MTLTSCIKMVYKAESSHVSVSQSLNSSSIKTGHRILERIYVQLNQRRPGRVSVLSFVFLENSVRSSILFTFMHPVFTLTTLKRLSR